jgi:hypothetical protein
MLKSRFARKGRNVPAAASAVNSKLKIQNYILRFAFSVSQFSREPQRAAAKRFCPVRFQFS